MRGRYAQAMTHSALAVGSGKGKGEGLATSAGKMHVVAKDGVYAAAGSRHLDVPYSIFAGVRSVGECRLEAIVRGSSSGRGSRIP